MVRSNASLNRVISMQEARLPPPEKRGRRDTSQLHFIPRRFRERTALLSERFSLKPLLAEERCQRLEKILAVGLKQGMLVIAKIGGKLWRGYVLKVNRRQGFFRMRGFKKIKIDPRDILKILS